VQTVGFTLCVSAAVETTGWIHTQQRRRDRYSADGGGGQTLAKLGVETGAHHGAGESEVLLRRQTNGGAAGEISPRLPLSSPQPDLLAPG